jgi:hypothetical protein
VTSLAEGKGLCARAQIRRPNNYDPSFALFLGPTDPDPTMNLESLDIVKTIVQDSPHKLFLGGLPCDWNEEQARASARDARVPLVQCVRKEEGSSVLPLRCFMWWDCAPSLRFACLLCARYRAQVLHVARASLTSRM